MANAFDELSRQRLDFDETPDGKTRATLTVTLQDGSVHRYSATTDEEEIDSMAAALAAHEVKARQIAGECSDDEDEIAGFFSSIGSAFKGVANVAKKVATSKVFKAAATGIMAAAPVLGPLAPAALAVGGAMHASSKLASMATAAEAGAKHAARALGLSARRAVEQATPRARWSTRAKVDPKARYTAAQIKAMRAKGTREMLLAIASAKRKNAFKLANKKPKKKKRTRRGRMRALMAARRKKKRGGKKRAAPRRGKKPNIAQAARAGRLMSNKGGAITMATLRSADRKGRVYWIAA